MRCARASVIRSTFAPGTSAQTVSSMLANDTRMVSCVLDATFAISASIGVILATGAFTLMMDM
jgi:hypothetical protein